MGRFVSITLDQMKKVLEPLGFRPMTLPNTKEHVFGKVLKHNDRKVSLRVYTSINPNGVGRGCGQDAIRVMSYIRDSDGDVQLCGKIQRVLRIATWKLNLKKALDNWAKYWRACPKCGEPMVIRNGQSGEFWACTTYHKTKCNGKPGTTPAPAQVAPPAKVVATTTVAAKPKSKVTPKGASKTDADYRIPDDKISTYQRQAEKLYREINDHLILDSRAGGGKTTMLKHLASYRPSGQRWKYLAYGRRNAREGRKKMPPEVGAVTTHSFCSQMLREAKIALNGEPDRSKNYQVMQDVYPAMSDKTRRRMRKAMFKLIDLCKNFAVRVGDEAAIRSVLNQYTFDLADENEVDVVIECVNEVLELSVPGAKFGSIFTFDDMLWWSCILNLEPPKYDGLYLDEVQDFNACQLEIVSRCMLKGTRIVAVGDPFQACYRFRGADSDAFDKMSALLRSDPRRPCKTVLLPTNYRSATSIIDHVRETTIVKDIEAAPGAIKGEVRLDLCYNDILGIIAEEFSVAA